MESVFREAGEDVLELGLEAGKHDFLSIVVANREGGGLLRTGDVKLLTARRGGGGEQLQESRA